ncbi:hypothetical protein J6590_014166 [Homalodisca vitripennis]|nr:hypothetical protein J6590_014166 [Homalodisca vitripennis]
MEVIEAEKRGTTLYVYENYLFRKSRSSMNGDKLYVACVFNGCKATGQIKRDEFIPRKCHNHGPEELRIQKLRLRADLRKVAEKHRGPGMKRAYDEACERLYLRLGLAAYLLSECSGAEVSASQDMISECVTIMDQPSTSSTNRNEVVCRKYYLRLDLISERSGAEVSASLDIVYCSLDRVANRSELVCQSFLSGM